MKTQLRIAELAQEQGLSQAELARKTGLNTGTIMAYWHNRLKRWDIDALEKIASALGVQVRDLINQGNSIGE